MYSVLALVACRLRNFRGHQPKHQHTPEYFMDKALHSLRTAIGDEDYDLQEEIVLDVLFVAIEKSYNGNIDGALTHLRMITHFVDNLGGFGAIDRYTKEIFRVTGIFIASMTLNPSLWDLDDGPAAFSEGLGCSAENLIIDLDPSKNIVSFPESFEGFDEHFVLAIQDVVTLARAAQVLWDCHGVEVMAKDRN